MKGVHGVFLMLTMMEGVHITAAGIAAEQRRGKAVVELAKELGVRHFVYSSLNGAGADSGVEYYAAKQAIEGFIAEAGLPATILRPVFFMDNFASFNRPGDYLGRTVPLAGDRLTPPQIAAVVGRIAGLPARSNEIPVEQVKAFDEQVGKMFAYFNEGPDQPVDTAALRAHHPDLLDFEGWLRATEWRP